MNIQLGKGLKCQRLGALESSESRRMHRLSLCTEVLHTYSYLTYTCKVSRDSVGNWFLRSKNCSTPAVKVIKLCMGMENHAAVYPKLGHVLKYPSFGSTFVKRFHLNKIGLPSIEKIHVSNSWNSYILSVSMLAREE